MLIAHRPEQDIGWVFVTRRGRKLFAEGNLTSYTTASRLWPDLDDALKLNLIPLFIRGDFDTAVFQAFKEVEVRVRDAGGFSADDYGTDLMRKAFNSQNGPLTDTSLPPGERDAISHLFAGAIGSYKNPSSHRDVNVNDPNEAVELILLANHLLRIVNRRKGRQDMPAKGNSGGEFR
jgi:uncharacterized protein (TIGR02391 family)